MVNKWEIRGNGLIEELKNLSDEKIIETLAKEVIQEIIDAYPKINSRKNPLSEIRKLVMTEFPSTEKQQYDYQYFTNSGKGNIPRYEHFVLKYLTLPKEDWDVIGDNTRKEYIESVKETESIKSTKLSDMQIEQLELDTESQEIVSQALENSGKSLAEFIQHACTIYAKTINGKYKITDTDLSAISTENLLDPNNKDYKTHPRKIQELTRRAIKAIQIYNDNCTEIDQKWFLSATAVNGLTGSRVQSVNEVLKDYKQMVDEHNDKHGLTAYTNRGIKRWIEDDINLTLLVPDGIDL